MIDRGEPLELVAKYAVDARNELKAKFRQGLPNEMLEAIEARNIAKYGNGLGPTVTDQIARYGSWAKVIDAACRPAQLS